MNNKITQRQYTSIILSSFIGVGIMSLASDICREAQQSAWISVLIGGLYPLILLLIASYIDNKMNHDDFWDIIKKLYGKYLGYIILLLFIIDSFFLVAAITAVYSNILKNSISRDFPHVLIVSIVILLSIITTRKGLTVIGRLCEISIYFIILISFTPILYIGQGFITYLQPCFGSTKNILLGVPKSILAYQGSEVAFFILAFISNRRSTKKSGIFAALIVTVLYTYIVLIIIYFFGWELTSQLKYSYLFLFKLVRPPVFSDFTAFFMMTWSMIILITLVVKEFFLCYSVSKMFNLDYKKSCNVVLPFLLVFSLITAMNDPLRMKVVDNIISYVSVLVFIWAILSFILTFIKSRGENK